jgi:hypothetical protein
MFLKGNERDCGKSLFTVDYLFYSLWTFLVCTSVESFARARFSKRGKMDGGAVSNVIWLDGSEMHSRTIERLQLIHDIR